MEEILTPISQTYRKAPGPDPVELLTPVTSSSQPTTQTKQVFTSTSSEEAVEFLKSQPNYETLIHVLNYLNQGLRGDNLHNIAKPSPLNAQIVHLLVTETVPNFWPILKESSSTQKKNSDIQLILSCLSSIAGLNAALAFLRALLQKARSDPHVIKHSHVSFHIQYTLELLSWILEGDDCIRSIWRRVNSPDESAGKRRALRQEFVALLAGGKAISLVAEAEAVLKQTGKLDAPVWIADSKEYVGWLARGVASWTRYGAVDDEIKLCGDVLSRSLRLGYPEITVKITLDTLILQSQSYEESFTYLLDSMQSVDQRKILVGILKLLSTQYLHETGQDESIEDYPLIWAAAAVVKSVIANSETRKSHMISWLTETPGAGIGEASGIRRATVAVLGKDTETITKVVEKSLGQFGDELYIKHAPIMQQEAHAQVLLLSAGYLQRIAPIKLNVLLRSSAYLTTTSNRMATSQDRARFIGMVVSEALSGLVYSADKKLDFHVDETKSEEGLWYKSLVNVIDQVGPVDPLIVQETQHLKPKSAAKPAVKSTSRKDLPIPSKRPTPGFIIEELSDSEQGEDAKQKEAEDEDDDLIPYSKPDSDTEDSDDDATLVNRNKPKAPVYTRDLVACLRDVESYDRQKLGLSTAPGLIRRKAHYGSEVSSHTEELASILVGLQDKFDIDDFQELRQQGMIALVVAQPEKMAPWFAKTLFDGDYSVSQRMSILVVLGLSGREVTGLDVSEYAAAADFPSKRLPAKTERHYALPSTSLLGGTPEFKTQNLKALPPNAIDIITQSLSQAVLAPLAAEAADAVSGPDVLKLSSFKSRLQQPQDSKVSRTTSQPKSALSRAALNKTASLLSTAFFHPLCTRLHTLLARPTLATHHPQVQMLLRPPLLPLLIKTLALLLHAAGPNTPSLFILTTEFWALLLALANRADLVSGELPVVKAVIFGLLTLIDVCGESAGGTRGMCEKHGREVVASMEWVGGVFEGLRGGDGGVRSRSSGEAMGERNEEDEAKAMAAGVMVRLKEAVDRHRGLLLGDLIGFA